MPPKKRKSQAEVDENRAKKAKQDIEQKKMKLIELVRQHEVLYNTAHPDHLNSSVTNVLWEEIANILQEDGQYVLQVYSVICREKNNNNNIKDANILDVLNYNEHMNFSHSDKENLVAEPQGPIPDTLQEERLCRGWESGTEHQVEIL